MLNLVWSSSQKVLFFAYFFLSIFPKTYTHHCGLKLQVTSLLGMEHFLFWLARNSFIKYLDYYCLDFLSKVHHMNAMTKHKTTYSYSFLNQSLRATRWQKEKKPAQGMEPIIFRHIFNFTYDCSYSTCKSIFFMLHNNSKSIRRSTIDVVAQIYSIQTMYISHCKSCLLTYKKCTTV